MSTEKYAGLPDIDTAADVYESNEIAFENNDPYDSDDSLLCLQQRSRSQGQKGDQSKDAGVNGGGIDEGHLPSRGEMGKKFGRSRGLGLGLNKSSYTYRPHSHSQPFSSLFASTSNLTSDSSSSNSDSDPLQSDEEDPNPNGKPDLNIDQLGPAPVPSGKLVITHRTKNKAAKHPRFKEEPSSRLRRLKREMMEVERQIQAQAQAQAQAEASTSTTTQPEMASPTLDPINRRRKPKPKPTPQAMMTQLLQLKSGLTTLEDRADELVLSAVNVDERKRREREAAGRVLLDKLEGKGVTAEDGGRKEIKQRGGEEGRGLGNGVENGLEDVSELDRRLEELERRVGTGSTTAVETVNPILPTLDRLESIVALLSQPNQLDAVSRRIKLLLNDLDKVSAPQNTKPGQTTSSRHQERPSDETDIILSTTDFEKINALYALLPRIDPLIPIVPALLTRLRSLSSLHASASSFQATMDQLQADASKMKETDGEMREVLDGLRAGMRGQGEIMKGNWERLGDRLKEVEERMIKLQSSS